WRPERDTDREAERRYVAPFPGISRRDALVVEHHRVGSVRGQDAVELDEVAKHAGAVQLQACGQADVEAEVAERIAVDVRLRGPPTETGPDVRRACTERIAVGEKPELEPRTGRVIEARPVLGEDEIEDRRIDAPSRPVVAKAGAERGPALEAARYHPA